MERRRHMVVTGFLVAAVIIVALLGRPREPVYSGKTLSAWMELCYGRNVELRWVDMAAPDESEQAIKQIGTNAIPYLLNLAAYENFASKRGILNLLAFAATTNSAPKKWASKLAPLPGKLYENSLVFRWTVRSWADPEKARLGFQLLGRDGEAAVPQLVKLMRTSRNPNSRLAAARSLGFIGPGARKAIPALVDNLTDPEGLHGIMRDAIRDATVAALFSIAFDQAHGQFRPECASLMIPKLTALLSDPGAYHLRIIGLLADLGPEAESALPVIDRFADDPNPDVRSAARKSRQRIGQ